MKFTYEISNMKSHTRIAWDARTALVYELRTEPHVGITCGHHQRGSKERLPKWEASRTRDGVIQYLPFHAPQRCKMMFNIARNDPQGPLKCLQPLQFDENP